MAKDIEIRRPNENRGMIHKVSTKRLIKIFLIFFFLLVILAVRKISAEYKANHETILFGLNYVAGDFSSSPSIDYESLGYKNIKINDTKYEVSVLPVKINALNDKTVVIAYTDKMGRLYNFRASAFLLFNKLILLPWCNDEFQNTNKNTQFEIFDIDFINGGVQVKKRDNSINLKSNSQIFNFLHLEGNASSDRDIYKDIYALKINYDPHYNTLLDCNIYFTDGSYVNKPSGFDCDILNGRITISWNTRKSECNGDIYEHEDYRELSLYYIDTSPVGFIIIGDDNRTHIYQATFNEKQVHKNR